ncbi:HNH endonuclease [Lacticigenium naphthae]|uniref:HNH endonuclease n=1 Tax=Lacticigenium naphthae TaxID=515351 RepID=UPI003CCBD236
MYCSNKCMHKYNHARKTLRRRKWAERNGQVEWDITVDKLVKLYDNTCYLCSEECDSQDYEQRDYRTFIAGSNYPSIEHVIPLSKGGTHTWDNVRLAHIHCNIIKSDKQIDTNKEQLQLPV